MDTFFVKDNNSSSNSSPSKPGAPSATKPSTPPTTVPKPHSLHAEPRPPSPLKKEIQKMEAMRGPVSKKISAATWTSMEKVTPVKTRMTSTEWEPMKTIMTETDDGLMDMSTRSTSTDDEYVYRWKTISTNTDDIPTPTKTVQSQVTLVETPRNLVPIMEKQKSLDSVAASKKTRQPRERRPISVSGSR